MRVQVTSGSNTARLVLETGPRPARHPWWKRESVEAEGVAPSSPRCERGILLLNYAPSWVTGGDRTLTSTFTACRAAPLHHGHQASFPGVDSNDHCSSQSRAACLLADPEVEAGGIGPSSAAHQAAALPLSYASAPVEARGVEPPFGRL